MLTDNPMSLYSFHYTCSCGKIIEKSEALTIEDVKEWAGYTDAYLIHLQGGAECCLMPCISLKLFDITTNQYVELSGII